MTPTRITIHCADTDNGQPCPVETIRQWHIERGWNDIGYHFVIQPDGTVAPGRAPDVEGAGVKGENEGNLHVCLVGRDRFTAAQFHALRCKIDALCLQFDIPKWAIFTHNSFPSCWAQGKTCPNMKPSVLMYWYLTQDDRAIAEYVLGV